MESESWIWPQVSAFSSQLNASLEPLRLEINFPYYALMSFFFRGSGAFLRLDLAHMVIIS